MTKENKAPRLLDNVADLLLFTATLASLLLLGLRIFYNLSFFRPEPIFTSGCEEEALFSIWKYTQNQPVYSDPHLIPFSASYFNWLFYCVYGSGAKLSIAFLHADFQRLPTICRTISLLLASIGVGASWLILGEFGQNKFLDSRPRKLAWCVLLIASPLGGFWLLTTRPDIGALALETTGFLFLLRYLRRQGWQEILWAVLFLYAAWSFKHSYVGIWLAGSCVLLMLRRWRALALFVTVWLSLIFMTLAWGGPIYRASLLFSQVHCAFHFSSILGNFISALIKMPFMALGLLALMLCGPGKIIRLSKASPVFLMLLLAALSALFLDLVFSGKDGAADNYYMPFALYGGLLLAWLADDLRPSLLSLSLIAASLISISGIGLVLCGRQGVIDWRPLYRSQAMLAEKLIPLPGPVFVSDRSGNVPWIQTKPPYFVVAFTYKTDENAGEWHERGGWEGLVREGYFGTVVTSSFNPIAEPLLEKYQLVDQDEEHQYYVHRQGH